MFTLKIYTDNAAFEDCQGTEVARILRVAADAVEGSHMLTGSLEQNLRDINGNKVGSWKLSGDAS